MTPRPSYDPLCALAVRLGTPEAAQRIDQDAPFLAEDFGSVVVDDLRLVALDGDISAADRVFHLVAPGGAFRAFEFPGEFIVLYRAKGIRGRLKVNKLPQLRNTLATSVVDAAASIRLKRLEEGRRFADA